MNYFRVKLVGSGLVALAGSAIAADDGQQPVERAADRATKTVVQAAGETLPAQPAVRFTPVPVTSDRMDPLWFSPAKPPSLPVATAPSQFYPAVSSGVVPLGNSVVAQSFGDAEGRSLAIQKPGIQPVSNQVPSLLLVPSLPMRILYPWFQTATPADNWPPAGPRVGVLPPSTLPNAADLPPIGEPPATSTRPSEPVPSVADVPGVLPLQGTPANQLPVPIPLQTQPGPSPTQTPSSVTQPPAPQFELQPNSEIAQVLPPPKSLTTPPESQQPTKPENPPNVPSAVPVPSKQLPPPRAVEEIPKTTTVPNVTTPPAGPAVTPPAVPAVAPPAVGELPTAPPELMIPAGAPVPGKTGVFGSEPIRISRDYPSLGELCGMPIRDGLESHIGEDRAGTDRGYVSAEYLLWWMSGLHVPVLATTSTLPTGTGFLGAPGTAPLLGPGKFLGDGRDGFRLRAGYWLDDCNTWALDGSVFFLGQRDADAAYGYNQYSVITRPVFSPNPIPGTGIIIGETGEAVAAPGVLAGSLTVHAQSVLWGADANLRRCLFSDCDSRATVFVGYRNLDLIESLKIYENIDVIGTGGTAIRVPDPIGTLVNVQDRFNTSNYFNGGQIGGTYERRWGRFDLDFRGSIALGATEQELTIAGSQTVTVPGLAPQVFRGGLLATGPNLGDFKHSKFSVVPELTLNAGYWILPNLKVQVGYNFIYWTDVLRPGNQIDSVINLSNVPNGPPVGASSAVRPVPLFNQSDLLVHGVQFGVELRW